ncbi:MAG: YcgN family cysteine cluster protein [Pseudomonadota bacterium]
MLEQKFWQKKLLSQMSSEEWEALCDGCGLCCLIKLEDEDTGETFHTKLTCHLLDIGRCRCSDYQNRHKRVADCLRLSPENIKDFDWLPNTCAYKLIAEGKELYCWHPLVSGSAETVHDFGISVRDWALNETSACQPYFYYIIEDDFLFPNEKN